MKLLGTRPLSVLLIGTLLFCHGVLEACTWSVALRSGAPATRNVQKFTSPPPGLVRRTSTTQVMV